MIITNCPKCGSMNITTAGVCANCGWSQFAQVTTVSTRITGEIEIMLSGKALLDDYKRLLFENRNLKERVAELEAEQRWIPVSERLPEFNKVVAVIDMSDKDSHLCNVYETAILVEVRGDTRFGFIGHSGWDSSDVTHWMPLPKLPEVQE